MEHNPNKCKAMHISKKKKLENEMLYNLNGQPIKKVMHIRDLGVTVSSDLSWSRHIEITATKANKTLGLIKRICRNIRDFATRRLLYCTLVRPKLECGNTVWSPYTENVQRRATKFILTILDKSHWDTPRARSRLRKNYHIAPRSPPPNQCWRL